MLSAPDALRDRAARLRAEALAILDGGAREVIEAALGPVVVTGSVALDLMVWPDLDLMAQVEASERGKVLELAPRLAAQLDAQGYPLARLTFRDEHRQPDPAFPDSPGLYLGLELAPSGHDPWKIDLWGWNAAQHAVQRARHAELRRSLSDTDRDLVLRIKDAARARPGYRSVDVYAFACAAAGSTWDDFDRFRRRRGA